LDIAIYEFQLPEICEGVAEAIERGVTVRLMVHSKSGTDKTTKKNLKAIGDANINTEGGRNLDPTQANESDARQVHCAEQSKQ